MRLGFQLLSLRPGQVGGQEIYLERLLARTIPQLGEDTLVLFIRPELAETPFYRRCAAAPPGAARSQVELFIANPEAHYGAGYAAWSASILHAARLDVVCFPLMFFFPRPLSLPVVLHVADLQYEFFPENFAPDQLAWRRARIPESVALADAVVTYSAFSARCLRDRLHAPADRLHVIPSGGFLPEELAVADPPDCSARAADTTNRGPHSDAGVSAPFILYPAADWPHKNHETLLRAFAELCRTNRPERLVLCGLLGRRQPQLGALCDALGVAGRVDFLGSVPRARLIELYRSAAVLAFPSRFEGFGLPLVEAMQFGCPIVASEADAVAETAGDAALYADDHPQSWARQLARALTDRDLRADLAARGRRRATLFDWTRTARQHLALLRTVATRAHAL